MSETKQGLEVVVKWVSGANITDVGGDYVPDAPVAADITFTYKRNVDFNWNYNVRPIHNAQGSVTHYKEGVPSGSLTISSLYVDESDFSDLRKAVTGASVPWGYMEIQYLSPAGALEFCLRCRRVVLSNRSVSNPEDDSTASMEFILFECPTRQASSLFS